MNLLQHLQFLKIGQSRSLENLSRKFYLQDILVLVNYLDLTVLMNLHPLPQQILKYYLKLLVMQKKNQYVQSLVLVDYLDLEIVLILFLLIIVHLLELLTQKIQQKLHLNRTFLSELMVHSRNHLFLLHILDLELYLRLLGRQRAEHSLQIIKSYLNLLVLPHLVSEKHIQEQEQYLHLREVLDHLFTITNLLKRYLRYLEILSSLLESQITWVNAKHSLLENPQMKRLIMIHQNQQFFM